VPRVTFLLSVYKANLGWLNECLMSLLHQDYDDYDIVCVNDDPQDDNLRNYLNSFAEKENKLKIVDNALNIGLPNSLNKGIELSDSEFIARIDSDDISCRVRLSKQVAYMQENSNVSLLGSGMMRINESGVLLRYVRPVCSEILINKLSSKTSVSFHPTWLLRRNVVSQIGGYRDFRTAQDFDFTKRMAEAGFTIHNMNLPLIHYREHKNAVGISKKKEQLKNWYYISQQKVPTYFDNPVPKNDERSCCSRSTIKLDIPHRMMRLSFIICHMRKKFFEKFFDYDMIVIVSSYQDYIRYVDKLIDHQQTIKLKLFYYERPSSLLRLFFPIYTNCVLIIGSRAPDLAAVRFFNKKKYRILITQHNINDNRTHITFKYVRNNIKKLIKWMASIQLLNIARCLAKEKKDDNEITVTYFENFYKQRWRSIFDTQKIQFLKCDPPDPLVYGTEITIKACLEKNEFFFVDEPLTQTLGLSAKGEVELIKNLIRKFSIQSMKVKLHPRSQKGKFNDIPEIEVVDSIFLNSNCVFGYRSGLLKANFSLKTVIYQFDPQKNTWFSSPRNGNAFQDYVKEVKTLITGLVIKDVK